MLQNYCAPLCKSIVIMKDYVIIVAGGNGTRMKADLPKQFLDLNGKPVLLHTIEKFFRFDAHLEIIIVLNADYVQFWKDLARTLAISIPHRVVPGGPERFHSVKNALDTIQEETGIVGIHDAVRPLVSLKTLESCYAVAREKSNAIPVTHLNDTLREVHAGKSTTVDRNLFRVVQTPQCFELSLLKKAYEQQYHTGFTDDASVLEAMGEKINLVEGNRENIKITTAEDLRMARALLET